VGTTADRNDPALKEVDPETGLQKKYLVLSQDERNRGFKRPFYDTYKHIVCGAKTQMGRALSETYAVRPDFYQATYCVECKEHKPVGHEGEFLWVDKNGRVTDHKVGT
jgi:hypothetical protein